MYFEMMRNIPVRIVANKRPNSMANLLRSLSVEDSKDLHPLFTEKYGAAVNM